MEVSPTFRYSSVLVCGALLALGKIVQPALCFFQPAFRDLTDGSESMASVHRRFGRLLYVEIGADGLWT